MISDTFERLSSLDCKAEFRIPYPANDVESLVEKARVGRPLSGHQLQQKHSKAIHV
jgi:hypothetical protein